MYFLYLVIHEGYQNYLALQLDNFDYKELKSIIDPIKIDKIGYFENISDHYGIVTEIN